MAKASILSFRKYIKSLDEEKLRAELETLFTNVGEVRAFYSKNPETEKNATPKVAKPAQLEAYKKKIYSQFWTPKGNPKTSPSNANIRKYILEFEKSGFSPKDVIDLILYRVEVATNYADTFGGMSDSCYNAAANAFEKAVKLMAKHHLFEEFTPICDKISKYSNLDGWYMDQIGDLLDEYK